MAVGATASDLLIAERLRCCALIHVGYRKHLDSIASPFLMSLEHEQDGILQYDKPLAQLVARDFLWAYAPLKIDRTPTAKCNVGVWSACRSCNRALKSKQQTLCL